MTNKFSKSLAVFWLCLTCCRSEELSPPDPSPASTRQESATRLEQTRAQKKPGHLVLDPTFELRATAVGPYAANKLGQVVVTLRPRGGYHINQEFPTALSVSAPKAISLYRPKLGKAEAAQFDKQHARFDIPLTPLQSGLHAIRIEAAFAVCTPKTCIPEKRTLALNVSVE